MTIELQLDVQHALSNEGVAFRSYDFTQLLGRVDKKLYLITRENTRKSGVQVMISTTEAVPSQDSLVVIAVTSGGILYVGFMPGREVNRKHFKECEAALFRAEGREDIDQLYWGRIKGQEKPVLDIFKFASEQNHPFSDSITSPESFINHRLAEKIGTALGVNSLRLRRALLKEE